MATEERTAKWILGGMIFFAVVCSMFFSSVIMYTQSRGGFREMLQKEQKHPILSAYVVLTPKEAKKIESTDANSGDTILN